MSRIQNVFFPNLIAYKSHHFEARTMGFVYWILNLLLSKWYRLNLRFWNVMGNMRKLLKINVDF